MDVAVVIPVYNPGPYLVEALASVRAQSFTNWHIYVVDDGGTEDVSWLDREPSVTRLRQTNRGVSSARNHALSMLSEPLVAFLDQDDRWRPDKLAHQVEEMHADVAACFTWAALINGAGDRIGEGYGRYETVDYAELMRGGVTLSSLLVTTSAAQRAGGFDPTLRIVQDWDFVLRLAQIGRITPVRKELTDYRTHGGNQTDDYRRMAAEAVNMLTKHALDAAARGDRRAAQMALQHRGEYSRHAARQAAAAARASAQGRAWGAAARHLAWSARTHPPSAARALAGAARSRMTPRR